ncbi:DUF3784 domain-containing protein [Candidatus Contubernalis alkaliaceticus]|uniref:DUF3784 domain-containing protein n=1 Tax=Candidatus Contubernalis alkaliaceticus TaxID=338645 RepID=UPI001F4BEC40|nr:DUF3784 domain-containing protein [Candidatus Contubernalis alkalaceticus]UNC92097.1 DUF3784 domain-containing protein [Candidatus Contubernalis alkalaceticus]
MVLIAITAFMGLTCFVLGYLVGKKQMVEILAGYDPKKVKDQERLAKWVGANLILMGILAFVSVGLMAVVPEGRGVLFLVYALGAIPLLSMRIVLGNRRFIIK